MDFRPDFGHPRHHLLEGVPMLQKPAILHLDDDPIFLDQVRDILVPIGVQLSSFTQAQQLLEALPAMGEPTVLMLDIYLDRPGPDGKALAQQLRTRLPHTLIVMCSDLHDASTIRDCIARGADDFLFKGSDMEQIRRRIEAAVSEYQRRSEQRLKQRSLAPMPQVVGRTCRELCERIPRMINSALTSVHVYGETGTGKEVIGDLFAHFVGERLPFIRIHCGAIPAGLIESELFGHVKGAFTGAQTNKIGLFEQADGGWVFLDEVATLSAPAQVALLRVLENQELRPVGATQNKKVHVRVLSATNENLEQLVQEGKFRRDLWQRLCEAVITLSPLRERMDEFDELLQSFCQTMRGGPYEVSASAVEVLKHYDWSNGNIRELRNCLRAMTEHAYGGVIAPSAIPAFIWEQVNKPGKAEALSITTDTGQRRIVLEWGEGEEWTYEKLIMRLLLALVTAEYQKLGRLTLRQLAKNLGIPRSTLSTKLQELVKMGLTTAPELRSMVNVMAETEAPETRG
jgi:DNA-binding NtrC family response regulator